MRVIPDSCNARLESRSVQLLSRLAAILGCRPEAFLEGRSGGIRRLDHDTALWHAWQALDTDAKRERALFLLRELNDFS